MNRIHFRAKLTGGSIVVPPEIVERVGDEEVEISIERVDEPDWSKIENGLRYLTDHPLGIKDFKAPSKDEIYSRDWVTYLDSNVWLYSLLAESDAKKHQRANDLINSDTSVATIQVINEVCRILSRKGKVSERGVQTVIRGFYLECSIQHFDEVDILDASALRSEYNFSFWDSLHVAAALKAGVSILYSEDMQDGLIVRGKLKIENPFR